MKGYKAFNPDLTCLGYQFNIDDIHVFKKKPVLCRQGFHFCTTLEDVVKYYLFPNMRVFEIEATGIITEAKKDCSKRACNEIKLIKEISLEDVAHSITVSEWAYMWARCIGNRDIMISKINESEYAFEWAIDIGNIDIMIDRITDSEYACKWVEYIGNKDIMKLRVTERKWIKLWNKKFPNDQIN